jgi:DNA-binding response OmpR family regulator
MSDTVTTLSIAIVEDDRILREELSHFLSSYGHVVHEINSGPALDDLAQVTDFDILILDLNLPGPTGFQIAQSYRSRMPDVGIIVLSARTSGIDRIKSYQDGADIYIPKPCPPQELLAAVNSLARRVKQKDSIKAWKLDPIRLLLTSADGSINIQLLPFESGIIAALARAPQNQLSADSLCTQVTESKSDESQTDGVTRRALENKISRLRKKFSTHATHEPSLIRSIRGGGYQLCVPITIA